jgi:inner membrane protein
MDPVTHTLVGATLAQTGLKRRTALGTATLVIGANLPDVDGLAYFWGSETAVWFRRGLTHGILALVVLPLVLTGLVMLWDRTLRRRSGASAPVLPRQVLLLACIAIASHPLLDFLNTYGMRWLAPFSSKWFYGDTLFIIDPWVWAMPAAGLWLSRRAVRWPKLALAVVSSYVVVMALSNIAARGIVKRDVERTGARAERIMVSPLAATPFSRWVVVDDGDGYWVGMFDWLPLPRFELEKLPYDRDPPDETALRAARDPDARKFLSWARFPYYVVERRSERVHIGDARYTLDPEASWAAVIVTLSGRRR